MSYNDFSGTSFFMPYSVHVHAHLANNMAQQVSKPKYSSRVGWLSYCLLTSTCTCRLTIAYRRPYTKLLSSTKHINLRFIMLGNLHFLLLVSIIPVNKKSP